MKKILTTVFLMALTLLSQAQDTPTADAIIDKYLAAVGGKEAIAKIEDLNMGMAMEFDRQGQTMTIETEIKQKKPNKFMTVSYAFGQESGRTICDGNKVSSVRTMMGNTQSNVLEGAEAAFQILQSVAFPEMLYATYNITKTVAGKEDVAGKSAWKIEFATTDGKKWSEFFDVESGLKLKRSVSMEGMRQGGGQGGQGQAGGQPSGGQGGRGGMGGGRGMGMMGGGNVTYSNYKEIKDGGGVKIPFSREMGGGQFVMKAEITSAKANKGVKEKEFEIK